MGYIFLFEYGAFMLVISTDIFHYDPAIILFFGIFQASLEIFEFIAGWNKLYDLLDYFLDFWNYLDMIRVTCAILYFYFDN